MSSFLHLQVLKIKPSITPVKSFHTEYLQHVSYFNQSEKNKYKNDSIVQGRKLPTVPKQCFIDTYTQRVLFSRVLKQHKQLMRQPKNITPIPVVTKEGKTQKKHMKQNNLNQNSDTWVLRKWCVETGVQNLYDEASLKRPFRWAKWDFYK